MTSNKLTNWEDRDVRNLISFTSWADHKEMFGGTQTGTATYRGLRPNGTTFYQSEISLLLPPKCPVFFLNGKRPLFKKQTKLSLISVDVNLSQLDLVDADQDLFVFGNLQCLQIQFNIREVQ